MKMMEAGWFWANISIGVVIGLRELAQSGDDDTYNY